MAVRIQVTIIRIIIVTILVVVLQIPEVIGVVTATIVQGRLVDTTTKEARTFQHSKLQDNDEIVSTASASASASTSTSTITARSDDTKGSVWRNRFIVDDEYIVIFNDNVTSDDVEGEEMVQVQEYITSSGGHIQHIYNNTFKGISIQTHSMPISRILSFLDLSIVKYAIPNIQLFADETDNDISNDNDNSSDYNTNNVFEKKQVQVQYSPPWGLDRIDQRSNRYVRYDRKYTYSYDGTGVYIYIVDSGIQLDHTEFDGRASCGYSVFENDTNCIDWYGHGTHVAGIAAGKTYGVAKNAYIISVKVIGDGGRGSLSSALAGIEYVTQQKKDSPTKMIVMNMSFNLSNTTSAILNDVVNAAVDAGVVAVVSAGNTNIDSCQLSPASTKNAITVGSTTRFDSIASFSNIGLCVDIFAPGTDVVSAYPAQDSITQTETNSGTSMSAPFVAGVAALHLQKNPNLSPIQVWTAIQMDALRNKIRFWLDRKHGSPNLLLNMRSLR